MSYNYNCFSKIPFRCQSLTELSIRGFSPFRACCREEKVSAFVQNMLARKGTSIVPFLSRRTCSNTLRHMPTTVAGV